MSKKRYWILTVIVSSSLTACIEGNFSIPEKERVRLFKDGPISICRDGVKKCTKSYAIFVENGKYGKVNYQNEIIYITAKKLGQNDYLLKYESNKKNDSYFDNQFVFAHFDKDRTVHIEDPQCYKTLADKIPGITYNISCKAENLAGLLRYRSGLLKYYKENMRYKNHFVDY